MSELEKVFTSVNSTDHNDDSDICILEGEGDYVPIDYNDPVDRYYRYMSNMKQHMDEDIRESINSYRESHNNSSSVESDDETTDDLHFSICELIYVNVDGEGFYRFLGMFILTLDVLLMLSGFIISTLYISHRNVLLGQLVLVFLVIICIILSSIGFRVFRLGILSRIKFRMKKVEKENYNDHSEFVDPSDIVVSSDEEYYYIINKKDIDLYYYNIVAKKLMKVFSIFSK